MPTIACWNSFFLFSLKGLALFSLEIFSERETRESIDSVAGVGFV
jgi:hypothetical protein